MWKLTINSFPYDWNSFQSYASLVSTIHTSRKAKGNTHVTYLGISDPPVKQTSQKRHLTEDISAHFLTDFFDNYNHTRHKYGVNYSQLLNLPQ